MSWNMSPRYGHGILVSGYPVLTAVNWPYCECPILKSYIKDVDLPRHAWDTPPFLLIVSPTPPVQSVDAYVRSVNHVTTKRKEVDHIPWVWGSVPRALRARGSPAKNSTFGYFDGINRVAVTYPDYVSWKLINLKSQVTNHLLKLRREQLFSNFNASPAKIAEKYYGCNS